MTISEQLQTQSFREQKNKTKTENTIFQNMQQNRKLVSEKKVIFLIIFYIY